MEINLGRLQLGTVKNAYVISLLNESNLRRMGYEDVHYYRWIYLVMTGQINAAKRPQILVIRRRSYRKWQRDTKIRLDIQSL